MDGLRMSVFVINNNMKQECEKCGATPENITTHPDGRKLCFDCACAETGES